MDGKYRKHPHYPIKYGIFKATDRSDSFWQEPAAYRILQSCYRFPKRNIFPYFKELLPISIGFDSTSER